MNTSTICRLHDSDKLDQLPHIPAVFTAIRISQNARENKPLVPYAAFCQVSSSEKSNKSRKLVLLSRAVAVVNLHGLGPLEIIFRRNEEKSGTMG